MAFFGIGKKREVLDLSEKYKKQKENEMIANSFAAKKSAGSGQEGSGTNPFSFFESYGSSSTPSRESSDLSAQGSFSSSGFNTEDSAEGKRKKLAKRIMDMTSKLEDISNQLYHLQQRVEVLERKTGTRALD